MRLGVVAWDVVISSNVALRLDGLPRSGQRRPDDPGVAVWFKLDGERRVLACDRWDLPEHNLRAIVKHIESLRGQERWGGGSIEQAFSGYKALPNAEGEALSWREILELVGEPTEQEVRDAYRSKAKHAHPDMPTGSHEAFAELRAAYEDGLAAVGAQA